MNQHYSLSLAQNLIASGETAKAINVLKSCLDESECAVRLQELLIGERKNEQARPIAERLAAGSGAQAHVSQSILAFLDGDLRRAVTECKAAIQIEPQLATAHNHLGRALQNMGQAEAALAALRQALTYDFNYPEAWNNLGHVLRASGQLEDAVDAYERALNAAPGYHSAELNLGITLSHLDQTERALASFEVLLERDPNDLEAMLNAGLAQHVLGDFTAGRQRYEQVLAADPEHATAWCYLGMLLSELQESDAAVHALQTALGLNPMDIDAWVELAAVHEKNNRLDVAAAAISEGAKVDPHYAPLRLETARLQRRSGDLDAALKTLRPLAVKQLPARLAQQYYFELGQALDRNGEFDKAIEAFGHSNQLLARGPRRRDVDHSAFGQTCQALEDWLRQGAAGAQAAAEDSDTDTGSDLCFLLGFPRSGTTLLDTFLNAHSEVNSIEKRPTLEVVIDQLRAGPEGYPGALAGLDGLAVDQLRGLYRDQVRQYLPAQAGRWILDKAPLRSLHIGLIHRLFPAARILFALRHPCDVVLGNFMRQYVENEAFVHFDTLEQSAAMYDRVMRLWQGCEQALSLNSLDTRYERLVTDTDDELQRICEFLDIQFQPKMLDAQARMEARSHIRTDSYQQVAEPIYQRSLGRWTNYRSHFEPLLKLLGPHIERLGYSLASGNGHPDRSGSGK